MLIDHKSIPWALATGVLAVASVGLYLWDSPHQMNGPSGSSPVGLAFGGAAFAIMLFCAGLGLRRRVPHWRLGSAHAWMRGHIWLGLLTVLFVALHGAFRTGGVLTTWLWVLLGLVTISGVLGLILQQVIPSLLLHTTPGETVAQQLDRQLSSLTELADGVIVKFTGSLDKPSPVWDAAAATPGHPPAGGAGGEPLRMFYAVQARAYLNGGMSPGFERPTQAQAMFASLRTMCPPHIHPGIDAIEELCDRRRQLKRQRLLMRVFTAWLIVHVPLSWVLLMLTTAHAVGALRYGS
ncbi:MAG: hypothetical protein K8S99_16615 [Planctomycetes bacterium]|nr:hypothetical protein [Planctomycetota bacterium]